MQSEWEPTTIRDVILKTTTWNPSKESRLKISYIDVSAVSRERSEIDRPTEYLISEAPGRARKVIRANDTIFATIRPGLRRIAQVPDYLENELASTAFCVLRPNLKKIDPDFLFYSVSTDTFVDAVVNLETGASYPAVRDRDISEQAILLPPLEEQKKIGAVLNLVRSLLLHQSVALTFSQKLKQATMQHLFTLGLRGEPQKETEIGLIPESWDVKKLSIICDFLPGFAFKSSDYQSTGVRLFKITNVSFGITSWEDVTYLPETYVGKYSKFGLDTGDIVLAMTRPIVQGGLKVAKIIGEDLPALLNQRVCKIVPNNIHPDFLYQLMFSDQFIDGIQGGAIGSQQPNISSAKMGLIKLPVPTSEEEQREIAEILTTIDNKIELHKGKKVALEELFKSLLHKLMTGEVRVSDLDLSTILEGPSFT